MKRCITGIAMALALGMAGPGRVQADNQKEDVTKHPGYVDFGTVNLFGQQAADVEVYLEQNLISMVAALARSDDPELADMLLKLKQIRVQTFEIEPQKLEEIENKTREMSAKFESQGWAPLVKMRDRREGSQTYVYMKWLNDRMQGLVVMNVDSKKDEASFVNLVGEIDPAQLEKLQRKFDIHGLDSLDVEMEHLKKQKVEKE